MCDSSFGLHEQLAAVIDVLAKSAIAEICRLVDDGYALMCLEISRSQRQNEALKRRLRTMEQKVYQAMIQTERARVRENFPNNRTGVGRSEKTDDCLLIEEEPLGKRLDSTPWSEEDLAAEHELCSPVQPDVTSPVQLVEAEEKPELCLIKKERSEEDSRNEAVDWKAGGREKRPVQETQNKAANHTEELTEQHRTRRAVWEVSGLESVLKAEGESECVETLQHRATEHRAEALNSLDSEFVMFERPGPLGSYCTPGGAVTEIEGSDCTQVNAGGDSPSEMSSEIQRVHTTKEAAGKSQSSLASQDEKPDVIIVDSVPVKMEELVQIESFWNVESCPGVFEMQKTGSVCAPYAEATDREHVALPCSDQTDANGFVSYENNHLPSSQSHMTSAVGAGKERYVCKYCGKSCSRASHLKVHQRVHTGEKPFSCTQCGKRFSQSCSLKQHQNVHSGEKPFGCLQCGKQFSDSSNLRKHRNIHTEERPFSCSQCGKRFKQSCYLKTHMRIHTGEKSLNCAYCGRVFASKYSLELHQLKSHMVP